MKNRAWVKIGVVGVDSGQVMLTDPCYIASEWKDNSDLDKIYGDTYIVTNKDGVKKEFKEAPFMSETTEHGQLPFNWETPFVLDGEIVTKNELYIQKRLEKPTPPPTHEYSYAGCCGVTNQELRGGQLNYQLGHAGAGVCVSSGYGDGLYDVYATYEDGRVAGVFIDFMGIM
jgi:hypothetical protein